jgi:hypothetical protein
MIRWPAYLESLPECMPFASVVALHSVRSFRRDMRGVVWMGTFVQVRGGCRRMDFCLRRLCDGGSLWHSPFQRDHGQHFFR